MRKLALLPLFALAALLLVGCNGKGGAFGKPASSGHPYEVLVVIDSLLWERPAGQALYAVIDTDVPGLPQREQSFHYSRVQPNRFSKNLGMFRNIIMVDINKERYTKTSFRYTRDENAQPQVILTIQSPNEADFAQYVTANKQVIYDFLARTEMNREIKNFYRKHSSMVAKLSKEMFDCELYVPKDLINSKKGKDFFWASSTSLTVNICMYAYPYSGPSDFTTEAFIQKRDSVMRENIPGEEEGMYMATEPRFLEVRPISVKGQYALEARGLWLMTNDAMGGPFVSHSRVDTENNRVIVVEGFIYAPEKEMKRSIMRRLEASLYTLNLPAEQQADIEVEIPEVVITADNE